MKSDKVIFTRNWFYTLINPLVIIALLVLVASFAAIQPAWAGSSEEQIDDPNTLIEQIDGLSSVQPAVEGEKPEATASSTLNFKQSKFDLGDTIGNIVLYLALLCALAAAGIFLLKRRLVSSGALPEKLGTHIRLLDRRTLSTRTTLHLLDVDGRAVMVCESGSGQSIVELSANPVQEDE